MKLRNRRRGKQTTQGAEEETPRWEEFVHLPELQHIVPDFLSRALAGRGGFPKDVVRAPGSQELTFLS